MRAFLPGLLIVAACARGALGWAEPNNFETLGDYLGYAESHNAGLKSKQQDWEAALELIPQAKALPDPQLQYGYYARQSDMQMGQMAGVMQTFPWFGKIDARTEAAIKSAAAAQQTYQAARLALFKEVKEGFHEFAYLAESIKIARDNLALLRHFEDVARTKYTAAEAGQPDLIRAQVELAKMEYVLRSLELLRKPAASKLVKALALPEDTNLPWPQALDAEPAPVDYEYLVSVLRQRNPELTALEFEIAAAKSRIELAKKNFYPDIGVGVEWTQFDRSGGNSGRDAAALVFSMNLPLWRGSYSAGQRQAQAMAIGKEQQRVDAENTLLARAAQSYYDYDDSIRRMQLYRDTLIPKGQELLHASETAYRAGMVDFLSLIDAQRLLLEYLLSYERAMADSRQKLAELEMLAGTELAAR